MKIKHILFITLIYSFLTSVLSFLLYSATNYYYNFAQSACNSGIAPCFLGFFESTLAYILIFVTGLILLRWFLIKHNIARATYIVVFGAITYLVIFENFIGKDLWHGEYLLLLYPVIFSIYSVLFNLFTKNTDRASTLARIFSIWGVSIILIFLIYTVGSSIYDNQMRKKTAAVINKLPYIEQPQNFIQNYIPNEKDRVRNDFSTSPYYPYNVLKSLSGNVRYPGCVAYKIFYIDVEWKVFWIEFEGCDGQQDGYYGPFRTNKTISEY